MTVIVGTIVMVVGTPVHIKSILRTSNIYSSAVDNVLKQAQKSTDQSTNNDLPINDPAIQKAVKSSFSPALIQSSTENIIDGTYHWLDGKTAKPDFRVDLTSAKQSFIQSVADISGQRLAALPVCTRAQLQTLTGDIDPFTAPCRPANLNIVAQKQKIIQDLSTNKDFLADPVITADTLKNNGDQQSLFDKASAAPKFHRLSNFSPWLLGVLALLFGAAVVFLHDTKQRGLRSVSISLISVGVLVVGTSLLSKWLFNKAISPTGTIGKSLVGNNFQQSAVNALNSLMQLINKQLIWFGISYIVIGAAILIALRFTRPNKQPESAEHKPTERPVSHQPVEKPTI